MSKTLFSKSNPDLNSIITTYFDLMYGDNRLLEAIYYILNKVGFSTDGAYCHFPDMNSIDESEHFKGVEFAVGYPPLEEDTVIVSEEECSKYIRLACERYIKFHPEDKDKINILLKKGLS